jgi:hypothetical protein
MSRGGGEGLRSFESFIRHPFPAAPGIRKPDHLMLEVPDREREQVQMRRDDEGRKREDRSC